MKALKKIYIEITNYCNLACSFCLQSARPRAFMHPDAFEEILRKITGGTGHISLHVMGEPLLHPDIELLLARSHDHGLRVNLTTNGTMLSRNRSMLLRQPAIRQINVSLHSFEAHGLEDALNAYLDGILDFISAAAAAVSPIFINLRMWDLKQTASPGEKRADSLMLWRLGNYFGLPAAFLGNTPTGRGIVLAPQVFFSREKGFTWPHGAAPDLGPHGYCRGLRDHIAILVDGTVVPCCLDAEGDMELGNIFRATLPEILADSRATSIRTGFARRQLVESVCRRCTYRQRFRGNIIAGPDGCPINDLPAGVRDAA